MKAIAHYRKGWYGRDKFFSVCGYVPRSPGSETRVFGFQLGPFWFHLFQGRLDLKLATAQQQQRDRSAG